VQSQFLCRHRDCHFSTRARVSWRDSCADERSPRPLPRAASKSSHHFCLIQLPDGSEVPQSHLSLSHETERLPRCKPLTNRNACSGLSTRGIRVELWCPIEAISGEYTCPMRAAAAGLVPMAPVCPCCPCAHGTGGFPVLTAFQTISCHPATLRNDCDAVVCDSHRMHLGVHRPIGPLFQCKQCAGASWHTWNSSI
jgi:hypothetical protein